MVMSSLFMTRLWAPLATTISCCCLKLLSWGEGAWRPSNSSSHDFMVVFLVGFSFVGTFIGAGCLSARLGEDSIRVSLLLASRSHLGGS
jgi:hypothetical protein